MSMNPRWRNILILVSFSLCFLVRASDFNIRNEPNEEEEEKWSDLVLDYAPEVESSHERFKPEQKDNASAAQDMSINTSNLKLYSFPEPKSSRVREKLKRKYGSIKNFFEEQESSEEVIVFEIPVTRESSGVSVQSNLSDYNENERITRAPVEKDVEIK